MTNLSGEEYSRLMPVGWARSRFIGSSVLPHFGVVTKDSKNIRIISSCSSSYVPEMCNIIAKLRQCALPS